MSQEISQPSSEIILDALVLNSRESSSDSLLKKNPISNNPVYAKSFEPNFREKYKGDEFDYKKVKNEKSFWQKLIERIISFLESIFGHIDPNKTTQYTGNVFRLFVVIIVGFVLYFFIRFFMNKNGNFFFSKKSKNFNANNQNLQENIHEINFPEAITKFENEKQYRSAVRYRFLLVLKKLNDQKHIVWNPEKTNQDYLAELKQTNLKDEFEELIYIFDYVWYGEFEVKEAQYHKFRQKFLDFK